MNLASDTPASQLPPEGAARLDRTIAMLLVCALVVLVLTFAGISLEFSSTRSFLQTAAWLNQAHLALQELSQESSRVERIDSITEYPHAKRSPESFQSASTLAVDLNTGAFYLEQLLRDNPSEQRRTRDLISAVETLSRTMHQPEPREDVLQKQLANLRQILSETQTEEREHLAQRMSESQRQVMRPLIWGGAYVGFSLAVWVILFTNLIRDVLQRRQLSEKLSTANGSLAATVEELGTRMGEAMILKNARDDLQLCVSAREAYACSALHLNSLLPGSSGAISIINNSSNMLTKCSTWGPLDELLDYFEIEVCCGLRTGRPRWRNTGKSEVHCSHFTGLPPKNYICSPLVALGQTLGVVYLNLPTTAVQAMAARRQTLLNEIVAMAAMAIAGLNLREKLENQSIRDALTNLFNRHFLDIALERELKRSARSRAPLALLMLDVDHFKTFNDLFGHEAGDEVLCALARCMTAAVRAEDIVCRYGGEEFVILLPEITPETALDTGERLRQQVTAMQLAFRGEPLPPISISVGVATYPDVASDAPDLLRMADRALYQAKRAGRNQVQLAVEYR
jgi:diguanylate cyclase (GGDEF)-like protein